MCNKYTPGPWVLDSDPSGRLYVAQEYQGKPGGRICEVFRNCLVDDFGQPANARLIAAAPDLLAALRMMVEQFTKTPSTLADSEARIKAHEAIAKATGEKA